MFFSLPLAISSLAVSLSKTAECKILCQTLKYGDSGICNELKSYENPCCQCSLLSTLFSTNQTFRKNCGVDRVEDMNVMDISTYLK